MYEIRGETPRFKNAAHVEGHIFTHAFTLYNLPK